MKKALSVLLIIAAIFGFYGGAVNLKDVLDCKAYWEEEGRKTDENLNKLEDGINQLAENEEAYLDGKDQIADAEVALANGEAQYAKGRADYAAAPAKLAAGEAQLAEGEKSYSDLQTLISGLKTAREHGVSSTKEHDVYWHDGFSKALKPGRETIVGLLGSQASMIGMLASDDTVGNYINNEASYPNFDKDVQKLIKDIPTASATMKDYAEKAAVFAEKDELKLAANALKMTDDAYKTYVKDQVLTELNKSEDAKNALKFASGGKYEEYTDEDILKSIADVTSPLHALYEGDIKTAIDNYTNAQNYGLAGVRASVASQVKDSPLYKMKDMLSALAAENEDLGLLIKAMDVLAANSSTQPNTYGPDEYGNMGYSETISKFQGGLTTLAATLNGLAAQLDGGLAKLKEWDSGFQTLYHAKDGEVSKNYPEDLADTNSGIPYAFKNMLSNSTIKSAVKKYDKSLLEVLVKYSGNRLKDDSMEEFDDDIVYLSEKIIPRALKVLAHVKSDANKQLAAGRKELAAGYADYKAAPAKLADAERQLADGYQQYKDGKAQLAEYEDGEQQVRDGLATLFGTEANGGLKSIADRIGGDGNFDDANGHLKLNEGLNGVQEGRNYSADSGVLITKEVLTRGIGTACGLAAALFALLAAILCFAKKNKGAGAFAVLTGLCGVAGIAVTKSAGTEFSSLAGSPLSPVPYIAFAILAVVALAAAIVNFGAKKEA